MSVGFGADDFGGSFGGDLFTTTAVGGVFDVAVAPAILPSFAVDQTADPERYGVDIDCPGGGHGMAWGLASGGRNVANALSRRLITPRGGLFYDPDYGFDVRDYLGIALGRGKMAELIQGVESECLKDVRVQAVVANVKVTGNPGTLLELRLSVVLADGPSFDMIFRKTASERRTFWSSDSRATATPSKPPAATGSYAPFLAYTVINVAALQALAVASYQSGRTLVMVSDTNRVYWLQNATVPPTADDSAEGANVVTSSDGVRQWIAG